MYLYKEWNPNLLFSNPFIFLYQLLIFTFLKNTMHMKVINSVETTAGLNIIHDTVLWQKVTFVFRILTIGTEHIHCPSDEVPSCSWPKEQWRIPSLNKRQKHEGKEALQSSNALCPGQYYQKYLPIVNWRVQIPGSTPLSRLFKHTAVAQTPMILSLFIQILFFPRIMKCFTYA